MSESLQETNIPESGTAAAQVMRRKPRIKLFVVIVGAIIVIPAIVFGGVVVFFARPLKVEGFAMSTTLKNGDKIFVWKYFSSLQRGDIVVFLYPEDQSKSFIKRIIGLPGETIDLDGEGRVTINGQPISEPYVTARLNQMAHQRWNQVRDDFKHINSDCYFVMGDNRDASNDSRSWGTVPRSLIYGKYMARYWSAD